MSRVEWIVAVIIAALLAIAAGLIAHAVSTHAVSTASRTEAAFKPACTASGGTPVHDGRQWQCLVPQGGAR